MTNWTPAQQAAIEDRGGGLLVSAAAGSGKTAVLTERAVRLIADPAHPIPADKLLIVTFTNAAAAELRARIGESLLRRSQADPASGWLRRQQMLLQRAPICTIDAFCLDLLRRHFEALDIPPDFAPADAGSVQALREAALADTLEAACQDPDFCAFADLYGKGRSDDAAGRAILQVYDFLRALPDYDRKMDEMLAPWQTAGSFGLSPWRALLLQMAAGRARAACGLLEAALADCRADFAEERARAEESRRTAAARASAAAKVNDKFAEPLERLESALALLRRAESLAAAGEWEPLYDLLTPYVLGMEPEPGLKGMRTRLAGPRKAAVKTRAAEAAGLFAEMLELIPCSEAEAEADRALAAPRLAALFRAVRDFDRRFAAKKKERKLLEFSDFEHLALRLLRGADGSPTALCAAIRAGYGAVMVDEYQDTNALQDALYQCLAAPDGSNLFLVGDLKQSIYRFRQADPAIFREKLEHWPPLPGGKARPAGQRAENALLALDANFRSAPAVVAGVNFFFEQLMSPDLGDTAYGAGQRLVCGAPGAYQGSVEACLLPDDEPETDAAWIAARIAALATEGEPVRDGTGTRPVRYEDCCILLAARADFPVYVRALSERGIPVYADARENLFEAPHIRPLVALLRVIDNPAQDIYLAAAMVGPVFGFTDDDLVRLRAAKKGGSLYGAVAALQDEAAGDGPFVRRVRRFYARLTELRRLARSVPAERLLEEIFASTGYLAALGAMENGQRRREDARRFAAFCAGAGSGGISALVRAIDAADAAGGDTGETVPGAARPGCVTIMTIHRSKGLQFPVVFVADTGRRFNAADLREPVLLHRVCGAGLRLRQEGGELYKTAAYTALAAVHEREMRSEQMRLLYVALTRAQDKLILTMPLGVTRTANPLEKAAAFLAAGAGPVLYSQCHSFAGWLRAALLVHPNGGPLRRLAGDLQLPFVPTDSALTLLLPDAAGEAAAPPAPPDAPVPADPALVEALRQNFAWRYPAAGLAEVPAKVSVTSIVHKAGQTALERPAFLAKDGLSAAEMGTALHAFLEHADFAALAAPSRQGPDALLAALAAERDRQTAARLTAPEIAEKLDLGRLARFFGGEAFRRVLAADSVLREYAFITALPAGAVLAAQGQPPEAMPPAAAGEQVLVQGIADILLVFPDHLELLDYKTDRGKREADFLAAYRPQLNLYALAIEKRFAPKKVTYKGIFSLELGKLIDAG